MLNATVPTVSTDSPSTVRTWGSTKERGKTIRLEQSHRHFHSLDVTTNITYTTSSIRPVTYNTQTLPARVNRLTDSRSRSQRPPHHRWSVPSRLSLDDVHTSLPLWSSSAMLEDEEDGSFSCDSLDLSLASSPPLPNDPNLTPTPRKRWQSLDFSQRSSLLSLDELEFAVAPNSASPDGDEQQQHQSQQQEHPRFVCWDLPFTPQRPRSKPLVRVHPRMRSEVNPPAVHKCNLKAHRSPSKGRSRTSSRERLQNRGPNQSSKSSPSSRPILTAAAKDDGAMHASKWTRRLNIQQLLPSKTSFSSSNISLLLLENSSADACSRRGTIRRNKYPSAWCCAREIHYWKLAGRSFSLFSRGFILFSCVDSCVGMSY